MPLYDTAKLDGVTLTQVAELTIPLGSHRYPVRVLALGTAPTIYFLHCPPLYARGRLYTSDADEHRRFLLLSYAALELCGRLDFAPDVVHCHDWQAALIPLLLKTTYARDRHLAGARSLLTIPLGSHRYQVRVLALGAGPTIYFLHCPALYARGRLYTHDADEHRRFLALSYGALDEATVHEGVQRYVRAVRAWYGR